MAESISCERWRPVPSVLQSERQLEKRRLTMLLRGSLAGALGMIPVVVFRAGWRGVGLALGASVVLFLLIFPAILWWAPRRDRRLREDEHELAYAGFVVMRLTDPDQAPRAGQIDVSDVRWTKLGDQITAVGGPTGVLRVGAESIWWEPNQLSHRKGFRPWRLAWHEVVAVQLLTLGHPEGPQQYTDMVLTFKDRSSLILGGIRLQRMCRGLIAINRDHPDRVPPSPIVSDPMDAA